MIDRDFQKSILKADRTTCTLDRRATRELFLRKGEKSMPRPDGFGEPNVLCTVYRCGDEDSVSSDDYSSDSDADSGEVDN